MLREHRRAAHPWPYADGYRGPARCGIRVCENCGARLAACPGCGEPVRPGKRFCGACGAPLADPEQAAALAIEPGRASVLAVALDGPAPGPDEVARLCDARLLAADAGSLLAAHPSSRHGADDLQRAALLALALRRRAAGARPGAPRPSGPAWPAGRCVRVRPAALRSAGASHAVRGRPPGRGARGGRRRARARGVRARAGGARRGARPERARGDGLRRRRRRDHRRGGHRQVPPAARGPARPSPGRRHLPGGSLPPVRRAVPSSQCRTSCATTAASPPRTPRRRSRRRCGRGWRRLASTVGGGAPFLPRLPSAPGGADALGRTAVIPGTAGTVSNRVSRRQAGRCPWPRESPHLWPGRSPHPPDLIT